MKPELLEAMKTIDRLNPLGDAIYQVRSRAAESGDGFEGNTWEHPDVIAYGKAVETVKAAIAEEK